MKKTTRSIAATILFLLLTLAVAFPAGAAAAPKLSKTKITVAAGRTYQLKVKNLKKKTVKWHSEDRTVAKVTKKGLVKAIAGGTTYITATVGDTVLSCRVRVQSLAFAKKSVKVGVGEKVTPELKKVNISKTVTFKSSNKAVATVSKKGVVRGKKAGTATITATYGKNKATIKVKVKKMADSSGSTATEDRWEKLLKKYQSNAQTNQLLFVKYTGGSKAEVELYEKTNGAWEKTLSCSGEVGKNGIGKTKEGDMKTPTGVYNLTSGYGIAANPGAKLPYVKVNKYLYWCGDKDHYNQLIDIRDYPHTCRGEHLIDYTQCYEYGMFLDYNKDNVYGKGSAIFLHVKGTKGYTAGCIAVSRTNMIKLLKKIGPGGKICIYKK